MRAHGSVVCIIVQTHTHHCIVAGDFFFFILLNGEVGQNTDAIRTSQGGRERGKEGGMEGGVRSFYTDHSCAFELCIHAAEL